MLYFRFIMQNVPQKRRDLKASSFYLILLFGLLESHPAWYCKTKHNYASEYQENENFRENPFEPFREWNAGHCTWTDCPAQERWEQVCKAVAVLESLNCKFWCHAQSFADRLKNWNKYSWLWRCWRNDKVDNWNNKCHTDWRNCTWQVHQRQGDVVNDCM